MNRKDDRRKAIKISAEALKSSDPLKVLSELNEYALYMCKQGIKHHKPGITDEELQKELERIIISQRRR